VRIEEAASHIEVLLKEKGYEVTSTEDEEALKRAILDQ